MKYNPKKRERESTKEAHEKCLAHVEDAFGDCINR